MVTRDTKAGDHVPCGGCKKRPRCRATIMLTRDVSAEEHSRSIWTCDDCLEAIHPSYRVEIEADRAIYERLGRK